MSKNEVLGVRLTEYLTTEGLKNTRQRQAILHCFLQSNEHLSLEELLNRVQKKAPGIGYATVYRTMKLFTEAGIAHERRFLDGLSKYEPVNVIDGHHDHLICENCGEIFEFEDNLIEEQQAVVAKSLGLTLTRHRLELWGTCIDTTACERRKRKV